MRDLQTCVRAKTKEEGNKLLYTLGVSDFAMPGEQARQHPAWTCFAAPHDNAR